MKTPKIILVLILAVSVLTSCSSNDSEEIELSNQSLEKSVTITYSDFEYEVFDAVNNYRISLGLNPLSINDLASYEAESHTNYMIETGKVCHDNFAQRQENLVNNAKAKKVGENVAFGYKTAQEVLDAWLASSSHKALIENKTYTHFGVAVNTSASGRKYYTQIFIKK